MKIREVFEYEVLDPETGEDIESLEDVFKIKDYVKCVDDMCCPFWDGDYCCTKEMKIHQYGYPYGYWWMNSDIDKTMETPETCKDYKYIHHERYPESDSPYIKEYKKFKEWDILCKQLEAHVSDPSNIYKTYCKKQIL